MVRRKALLNWKYWLFILFGFLASIGSTLAVELTNVDLSGGRIVSSRLGLMQDYRPQYNLGLDLDFNIAKPLYLHNNVQSIIDKSQHRHVEWNYELGYEIYDTTIYFKHRSAHILDSATPNGYEFYNEVGVRINLYRRRK